MNTHRNKISVPMPLFAFPRAGARASDYPLHGLKGMVALKLIHAFELEAMGAMQTHLEWQVRREREHRLQQPTTKNNKPKISRLKMNPWDGLMMIFEKDHAKDLLRRLAARVTPDKASREDLAQEAMIHLWQQELRCPEQSESWYIQSCLFHLRNYIQRGRSLDSPRRRRARGTIAPSARQADPTEVPPERDESPLHTVCANDILDLLLPKLKEREREVLRCLAEGLEPVDIARKLRVTRQAVGKRRRKIALVATKLGITPPSKSSPSQREPGERNSHQSLVFRA